MEEEHSHSALQITEMASKGDPSHSYLKSDSAALVAHNESRNL